MPDQKTPDFPPGTLLNDYLGKIEQPLNIGYPKNTLTVCMIVKNEAANIRQAIESFRPFADEIVVNDTGSLDGTVEILKDLGVKWIQTKWEDDFSLARNQSLELATSSWILWLDADDRIPADQINDFRKLKSAPLDRMFGLQVINTQAGRPVGASFMQLRMFPNHPELKFRFRVHEQIVYSGAKLGLHCIYVPTTVWHTGYENNEGKQKKARRNLELLQMEPQRAVLDVSFAASEGDSWFILNDYYQAIEAYQRAMNIPNAKKMNSDVYHQLPSNIGRAYQLMGDFEKAVEWLQKAIQWDPSKSEARLYLAECLIERKRPVEAEKIFREILTLQKTYSSSGNHYEMSRIFAYYQLGQLLFRQNRLQEAIGVLEEYLKLYPGILEAQKLLESCKKKARENETAKRPLLSLCMIVKDEEKQLGDCLSSVQSIVDEIIVVDTGSRDHTPDIASSFGAKVSHFTWSNDFSAARNRSLELAKGSWILWLDADDRITPEEAIKIKHLVENELNNKESGPSGWTFRICNTQDGGNTGSEFLQIRLFPNLNNLRFQFPVHEQILPALEKINASIMHSEIKILHTGYSDLPTIREKQIRNRSILQDQVANNKDVTPVTLFSLAGACFDLGEYEKAREFYLQSYQLAEKTNCDPHIRDSSPIKAASCLAELGQLEPAFKEIQQYFASKPDCDWTAIHPEALSLKAKILTAMKQSGQARQAWEEVLNAVGNNLYVPADIPLMKIQSLQYLGHYWYTKGQTSLGVDLLKKALEIKQGKDYSMKGLIELYQQYDQF